MFLFYYIIVKFLLSCEYVVGWLVLFCGFGIMGMDWLGFDLKFGFLIEWMFFVCGLFIMNSFVFIVVVVLLSVYIYF